MAKVLTKNEFMTMYINDMYRKRYEEKCKETQAKQFICEQGMKKGKAYTKKKNLKR